MLKSTQWLAAKGSYGWLTLAHKVAALDQCVDLNIFLQTRNTKAEKNLIQEYKFWKSTTQFLSSLKKNYMKNLHPFCIIHIFRLGDWKYYTFLILGQNKGIFSNSGDRIQFGKMAFTNKKNVKVHYDIWNGTRNHPQIIVFDQLHPSNRLTKVDLVSLWNLFHPKFAWKLSNVAIFIK